MAATHLARTLISFAGMVFRNLDECETFQLVQAFKREAYRIAKASPAVKDFKYKNQLYDALASAESNIAEGFHREATGEIMQFLTYARASAAEARTRLLDGVDRGYFTAADVKAAISLGNRSLGAIAAWQRSLVPFLEPKRRRRNVGRRSSKSEGMPPLTG